jgi:RNA polymerase sigma-70 factor (ECF subfamily)
VSLERPTFERIYEEHFDFVWRTVRRLGVAPGSVDDVTQEVFLVAHRKLDDWQPIGSLRAWLFGIARRVAKDQRRAAERHRRPLAPEAQFGGAPLDPQKTAETHQVFALVETFLGNLDEERQEIFFLGLVEGLPISEVAESLNLNPNTVYSRVRVLRRELADFLQHESPAHGGNDAP